MANKERPGVILYFDVRPCLKRLSPEDKGRLFEGILDYAEFGVIPEFEDMLGVAWDFIQPRIDRDSERYNQVSETRRKAAQKRWEAQNEEKLQMNANASFAMQTMPTTTSTSTTTPTSSSKTTSTTASTAVRGGIAPEQDFNHRRNSSIKALDDLAKKEREQRLCSNGESC